MTSRATSKASYRETRESGQESTQSDKILDIISIGGDFSMQEVLAAYRCKYGVIELSSVSARINKLKADDKLMECNPRKCSISDKVINPIRVNECTHSKYKGKNYMQWDKAIKDPDICWFGIIVKSCEDCGQDIEFARRVPVLTANEYMRAL